MRTLLRGGRIYTKGGTFLRDVAVSDGIIHSIGIGIPDYGFDLILNLNNNIIIPGFADVHVHLREPGFSYKETIETGTAAAARGGYTLVCAMPNLSPAPDSAENLESEFRMIRERAMINVLPYACISAGEKGGKLAEIEAMAGLVAGFSDDGKGVQNRMLMREAMLHVKACGGIIAAHCEDESLLRGGYIHDGDYCKAHGHRGICSESEWGPLVRDLELVRETGCRYHMCHVSTKESVELLREAKAEGLPVTCETAPHYLVLSDEDMREQGSFKMNPPLRGSEDRAALVKAACDQTIDVIATDHAPHSQEEKGAGLEKSLMGISGLETALPILYTKLVRPGIISFDRLMEMLCFAPRKILGLPEPEIAVGNPADITVLNLEHEYRIDPSSFLSKGRSTPFEGEQVLGRAVLTLCGGRIVWKEGEKDA